MSRRSHVRLAVLSATSSPDAAAVSPVIPETAAGEGVSSRVSPRQPHPFTLRMRNELLEQQYRARELFASKWLRVPGVSPLLLKADGILKLVKRIQALLDRRDHLWQAGEPLDSEEEPQLETWLQDVTLELAEISRQYAFLDLVSKCAHNFHSSVQPLETNTRLAWPQLRFLGDLIQSSIEGAHEIEDCFPLSGVQVASACFTDQPCAAPAMYTQGVTTARLIASCLRHQAGWTKDVPHLVMAALLQDLGWMSLAPHMAQATRRGPRRAAWLAQQHPQAGAALLGAVANLPSVIPQMIAQHHERLDGSGYPRRLTRHGISRMSRMLASAVRWLEIYEEESLEFQAGDRSAQVTRAAAGLLQEARCGWWDESIVKTLIAGVPHALETAAQLRLNTEEESLPALPLALSETHSPLADAARDRNLNLHGEETGLQGTHASAAAESSERRVLSFNRLD